MNPLIIALDVESAGEAERLIAQIGPAADFYKIGLELYAVGGMDFVRQVHAHGKQVFLDLKLYDISETVKRATARIAASGAVQLLTVHGSNAVMKAAADGRGGASMGLLAVTVLTSFDQADLADLGYSVPVEHLVELRVRKAVESRMDGVVCSPLEVRRVREVGGPSLKLVTPGVRSAGSAAADQKRIATPKEAIDGGADYLVIGRQVTRASDPRAACESVLAEIGWSGTRTERPARFSTSQG